MTVLLYDRDSICRSAIGFAMASAERQNLLAQPVEIGQSLDFSTHSADRWLKLNGFGASEPAGR
ncbi:hypothetical protein ACSTH1_23355, partial [Vibrio parahaemolyticus]